MANIIERLFKEFNVKEIKYCVLRKYHELPKTPKGDIDLLIRKKDFKNAREIVRKLGFVSYPFTEPHYFYFSYDKKIGLVNLDVVLIDELFPIKKFKGFYIARDGEDFRIKKSFLKKVKTNLKRKLFYLFRGKLICFIGPDGCGKSTMVDKVHSELKSYPIKKQKIYFGSRKSEKIFRVFDLSHKIFRVHLNKFLGRITFTDRYVYLTFRHNKNLNKLVRIIAPKPNKVYLLKVDTETILERKKELSKKEIEMLYRWFRRIDGVEEIDGGGNLEDNVEKVIMDVLTSKP